MTKGAERSGALAGKVVWCEGAAGSGGTTDGRLQAPGRRQRPTWMRWADVLPGPGRNGPKV